jgi:hypothetical protein
MTEAEWLAGEGPAALLDWLTFVGVTTDRDDPRIGRTRASPRKLRLFACACCRLVWNKLADDAPCERCNGRGKLKPHLIPGPGPVMTLPSEVKCPDCAGSGRVNRSRRAVEVAERFADGVARESELEVEYRSAWHMRVEESGLWALLRAALDPSLRLLEHHPQDWPVRHVAQAALLRDLFGNPFRPAAGHTRGVGRCYDPPWLGAPDVLALAQAAYEERDRPCPACRGEKFRKADYPGDPGCAACGGAGRAGDGLLDPARLAVLADALEEAGCDNWWLLVHLRGGEMCPKCLSGPDRKKCRRLPDGNPDCFEGIIPRPGPHTRGCWALDLILGKQ